MTLPPRRHRTAKPQPDPVFKDVPGFVEPVDAAGINGATGEVRRLQRVALARRMALDGATDVAIGQACDMNGLSVVRVLAGTSFGDGPYPAGWSKTTFLARMKERNHEPATGHPTDS